MGFLGYELTAKLSEKLLVKYAALCASNLRASIREQGKVSTELCDLICRISGHKNGAGDLFVWTSLFAKES